MNRYFAYLSAEPEIPAAQADVLYNTPFEYEGQWVISGYHSTDTVYPTPVVPEEFTLLTLFGPALIEQKTGEIKSLQQKLIEEIEGHGKWRVSRAIDMAEMDSDYNAVDTIMRERSYVRKQGDVLEASLAEMTYAELSAFTPVIDVSKAPDIGTRRITVGAFLSRLSKAEYNSLESMVDLDSDVRRSYNELRDRTHVLLDEPKIVGFITMMEQGDLLSEASVGYATRKEELLRDATILERYRQYSIL